MSLTAVFQKVPEGYIGFVEELPGANSQGGTLEEVRENLKEAVELVLHGLDGIFDIAFVCDCFEISCHLGNINLVLLLRVSSGLDGGYGFHPVACKHFHRKKRIITPSNRRNLC